MSKVFNSEFVSSVSSEISRQLAENGTGTVTRESVCDGLGLDAGVFAPAIAILLLEDLSDEFKALRKVGIVPVGHVTGKVRAAEERAEKKAEKAAKAAEKEAEAAEKKRIRALKLKESAEKKKEAAAKAAKKAREAAKKVEGELGELPPAKVATEETPEVSAE